MEKLTQAGVLNRVNKIGLRTTDIVIFGGGLITMNQASQWMTSEKHGRVLSNPVILMLDMMCDKHEGSVTHKIGVIKSMPKTEPIVVLDEVKTIPNKNGITLITDAHVIKKMLPEPAFMKKEGVVYFRYGEGAYMFAYEGQKEIVFMHDDWEITGSGDFDKLVGNISFY